jgi:hypothetical protein
MLDVYGASASNGTRLIIYGNNGTNAQRFSLNKQSDGSYSILTRASSGSSALDVEGASKAEGAIVQQYGNWNGNNQKWIFEKADIITDGTYKIRNAQRTLFKVPVCKRLCKSVHIGCLVKLDYYKIKRRLVQH